MLLGKADFPSATTKFVSVTIQPFIPVVDKTGYIVYNLMTHCRIFLSMEKSKRLWNESFHLPKLSLRKPSVPNGRHRNFGVYYAASPCSLPMKPGTPIPGVDVYKEKDPVVVLERSQYPEWVGNLAKPLPTLADLRRMPESEASDKDMMRYLKLTRRIEIKKKNAELAAQKR
jgi:Mitochondrial ribosomal protein L37